MHTKCVHIYYWNCLKYVNNTRPFKCSRVLCSSQSLLCKYSITRSQSV